MAKNTQHAAEELPKALELTFDAGTNEINLTLFEHVDERAVPLEFKFKYSPETPFCPIQKQDSSSENRACKDAYWKLWELDTAADGSKGATIDELKLDDVFQGEEVEIKQEEVSRFCNVVGNSQEAYKGAGQVPMDFSIKLAWRSIMRSIFPNDIDGNLLKLVHLSNGFTQLKNCRPLAIGDRVTSTSRIVSVTNSDSGKTVSVKGTVFLINEDGSQTPAIQAESSFLYRGSFTDFQNTFEKRTETTYSLTIPTPQAVAVLQSKEWFDWLDDSKPLTPGTTLIFNTESEYRYKSKTTYANVSVTGTASLASTIGPLKGVKDVAEISYSSAGTTVGNPVLEYLKRHGTPLDQPVMLASPYTITSAERPSLIYTPASNWAYSSISGDVNPIHVNPYFSDLANLPGTITHGMWTSAATRKYVEQVAADNIPERVVSYNVSFTAMVLPNSELQVVLKHVGQKDGNKLIEVSTFDTASGNKVVSGMAEVSQAPTAYVFTGQGSQEPGMGMELYASSEVARRVWDKADEHLGDVYGFSIIDIVKHNPQEITVHFGGLKGQRIRQRYMDMTYHTADKEGNVKTLPLFPDIDLRTSRYTFSSPTGLLFATQFAQIALVVTEKAAFEDMRAKGLVQDGAPFAGHSLGEYSALASIAEVLPISALVDVVFYRGITMQRAVERDSQNRSKYAMVAINPSRIGKTFTDAALREVVDTVSARSDTLLQIVNYNVDGQQYVAAGELVALQALSNVLNFLKIQKIDLKKLTEIMSVEDVREKLGEIVDECFGKARELEAKSDGHIKLERGFATIPLPGIDVPFHSRYLWAGVMPFRTYLSKKINPADLNPDLLVGKYIPNLTAEPFEISKRYCELVFNQTSSPRLEKVLKKWEEDNWAADENRSKLGYIILVELLAYQFASPVRWIETQDKLFTHYKFERLIELGPGPTLTGMAQRTLKAKYQTSDDSTTVKREIYCIAKNQADIYYIREDEVAEEAPAPAAEAAPAPTAAAAPVAAAPPPPAPAAASAGPAASVPDEPLKAVDTLRVIIAQKLKKQIGDISLQKNIKDMVGGKSTLQNEILGDLQAEFSSAPEKGEELPLEELGAALNIGYAGTLGKHTNGLVARMVGSKLPGGFGISAVKAYLGKQWGLGPGRTDGALLVGLTMEPAKRLGSEADAKAFLDSVAQAYAKTAGITLSSGAAAGGAGGGGGGAVVDSEALNKLQAQQDEFVSQQVDVLLRYLKRDGREGYRLADATKLDAEVLQAQLDAINREHGELYINGIQPSFEPLKARHFNSAFNWVRQDALSMFFDIIFGRLTTVDRDVTHRCLIIMNRADPTLIDYMTYVLGKVDPSRGPTYKLAKEFGFQLLENCKEVVGTAPLYKDVTFPTAPKTTITAKGDIIYEETNRKGVSRLEKYVAEMAAGSTAQPSVNLDKVHESISNLYKLVKSQPQVNKQHMAAIKSLYGEVVKSMGKKTKMPPSTGPQGAQGRSPARARRPSNQFLRPVNVSEPTPVPEDAMPLLHLKRKVGNDWQYSSKLTSLYLDILKEIATSGTTFEHKNALLTGVGKASIGVEIVKGLLSGGARVIITTSRYSRETVEYYQGIYQECGSRGSSLTVVPFNGGSKQDIDALVEYIYSTDPNNGLDMDLDFVLPFAAIPENGREIDGLDDKSELAHRVMLTNLLRLLGAVKAKKASRRFITRPTQVILPLSPNHGLFGNDGLYSESKISLETLFNRWNSESWGQYLCIAGAVIGWTRGTGLMSATNVVAAGVEELGCRTFSAKEMAFNILGLMHPLMFDVSQTEPVWADFNGGMSAIADLHILNAKIRDDINKTASTRKAIAMDNSADFKTTNGTEAESVQQKVNIAPRANFTLPFPKLPASYEQRPDLTQLQGLVDLEQVIVVTGYAEVGPFGSSRTRWQMEAKGDFTIEGLLELAFTLGLIRHFNGRLKNGQTYVGWVDAKSEEPVDDKDVRGRYEKHILEHTGVRLIEPELFRGYDPKRKGFTQEVEIQHDLEPIETNPADAERFKLEHGNKVDVWVDGDRCFVKFKKGAKLLVPKAVRFDRLVAGQIPTGWDARVFGIPDDIVSQTDRTALWALVCVAEALMASGITDPYELYKYVHPSEVGTSIGSGMGGMESLSKMFRDRREEKDVQNDILQETFINTVAGWVNLLLVSSNGPIKIPVGACATALQSLEIACDTIRSGKAKVMFAGGFDDFSEEGSYEFANMKATSNTETEFASGREPNEMSRPTTSTRAGFMESQGCGVQVLMSAKTAVEMGATIYGIVGYTSTASDKAGRSIPAPGRGILSTARQLTSKFPARNLEISYRKRQLEFRRKQISEWLDNEIALLKEDTTDQDAEYYADRLSIIEKEARRQESEAMATFGMLAGEGTDPNIAPLRRALAVWGLTIDDIGVASFHGTSTKANDKNESNAFNTQFMHLGRTKGNACPVIAQKWLTGHPKGGAAAWMTNGMIQTIQDALIPGNRNADNISPEMQAFEYLVYPSRSIQTDGIKAGLLKSFGFGQVGGECLVIHPEYLLAALDPAQYAQYKARNADRFDAAYRKFNDMFVHRNLVILKEAPPYTPELEQDVLLNPLARASKDAKGSYSFSKNMPVAKISAQAVAAAQMTANATGVYGVGTDVELISAIPVNNDNFLERNFTAGELDYCKKASDMQASLAGRWAAKEAVFKSLKTTSKGGGASMKDIEIVSSDKGPTVQLSGDAKRVADEAGIKSFEVSLSHAEGVALAVAVAKN